MHSNEAAMRAAIPGWMWRVATGLFLMTLALLISGCSEQDTEAVAKPVPVEPVVKVKVQKVEPVQFLDILTLPGNTEADGDVRLSAEIGGAVRWVGPAEGGRVQKGQDLVRIDVSAVKAKLEQAEVNLRLAEEQAQRRQRLYEAKVLSREELDESITKLDVARANVAEAKANYVHGVVRAPISGIVETLHADPGEFVGVGDPLMDIVNRDVVRVHVNVPELDVRFLEKDDVVRVSVDAWPDRMWQGRVDFISNKADSGTRTFKTRVLVDNADGAVRPGMLARVNFLRREINDAVTAPLSSIVDRGGERVLYIEEDGVARSRTIEIGAVQGNLVQILSGLSLGENLIVAGQGSVEEGVKVSVQ